MSAGQPCTHKNQGQKIMFGGDELFISLHDGNNYTNLPALSKAKALPDLVPATGDKVFKFGLSPSSVFRSSWFITSEGRVAYIDINDTYAYLRPHIIYKGKKYTLPEVTGWYTLMDVNVHNGRLWAVYLRAEGFRVYTATASGSMTLVHTYNKPAGTDNPAIPAFSADCSELRMGFTTIATQLMQTRYLTLGQDGTVAGVVSGTWDGGWSENTYTSNSAPYTSKPDSAGNFPPEVRSYSIRHPNITYVVGNKVHAATFSPHYWVCSQTGTTSNSYVAFPQDGPGATGVINDGGVVWTYGGPQDPDQQPSVTTYTVNPAYVTPEYFDDGATQEHNNGRTFEQYIQEHIDGAIASGNFKNGSIIEQPQPFANYYHRVHYQGNILPNTWERTAKVQLTFNDDSTTIHTLRSRRWGWVQYCSHIDTSPTSWVVGSGSGWYSGSKPIGWVRDPQSGALEPVEYRDTSDYVASGTITGELGGKLFSWASTDGTSLPPVETQALCQSLPASEGFSVSLTSSSSGVKKEGLFIGGTLQCETQPLSQDYYYEFSKSADGLVVPNVLPPSYHSLNYYASYASATFRQNAYTGGFKKAFKCVIFGNLQARMFYVNEHKATSVTAWNTNPPSTNFDRTKTVLVNGATIYNEQYSLSAKNMLATNSIMTGYLGLLPAGKKPNFKFLLAIFQAQDYGWGSTVPAGTYQLVVDSDGTVYTSIPTPDGDVAIGANLNGNLDVDTPHVVLNLGSGEV